MESHLQVDIISSKVNSLTNLEANIDIDLQVSNEQPYPVHVMGIELLIEEAGREERELKPITSKVAHSCIIQPKSSEIVTVPLKMMHSQQTPKVIKANLNIRDKPHGVYQVSSNKMRHMFTPKDGKKTSEAHLDGKIEGMHMRTFFPKEVLIAFDVQVKNANFLPLKLLHADFLVTSGETKILEKKLVQNTSIAGKSSSKVRLALIIPFQIVKNSFPGGLPSSIIPIEMDIKLWFKETFYGMYKIDARKTGVLVVPQEPEITMQKVVFAMEDRIPVAHLELLISNDNEFDLKLKNVEYQAFAKDTGSSLIRAKYRGDNEAAVIPAKGSLIVPATARPSSHEFGSVLWKLCKNIHDYNVKTILEADTELYGKFVFQR